MDAAVLRPPVSGSEAVFCGLVLGGAISEAALFHCSRYAGTVRADPSKDALLYLPLLVAEACTWIPLHLRQWALKATARLALLIRHCDAATILFGNRARQLLPTLAVGHCAVEGWGRVFSLFIDGKKVTSKCGRYLPYIQRILQLFADADCSGDLDVRQLPDLSAWPVVPSDSDHAAKLSLFDTLLRVFAVVADVPFRRAMGKVVVTQSATPIMWTPASRVPVPVVEP